MKHCVIKKISYSCVLKALFYVSGDSHEKLPRSLDYENESENLRKGEFHKFHVETKEIL